MSERIYRSVIDQKVEEGIIEWEIIGTIDRSRNQLC